jgi:uncharacterized DUF497 family protein
MFVKYEWDDNKDSANDTKHGIRFDEAKAVFADPLAIEFNDDENEEERFIRIGMSRRGILTVVYCEREEDIIRIISARKATKQEREKLMKDNYNIKNMKKRTPMKADPEATKTMISLRVDGTDLADLKREAERQGIPYQTLINSIVHRFLNGELIDKKEAKKIAG